MTSYTVYSDGWARVPHPTDMHEAMLRVLKNGLPYDGVRARISQSDVVECDQEPADYTDRFWDALLVVAAQEAEARIRHGEQPSRSPDGAVINPSCPRAVAAAGDGTERVPPTTELLSFGVE